MVADPGEVTLTNLRRIAQWADLVLTEASTDLQGKPRQPLRQRWHEILNLDSPRLRVITSDLAGDVPQVREKLQRDAVLPLLIREDPHRLVLLMDSDEMLDKQAMAELVQDPPTEPRRLGLLQLYGGIDRVGRSLHCCWNERFAALRDPAAGSSRAVIGAPGVASAGQVVAKSPSTIRFRSPQLQRDQPFGVHFTMTEPVDQVITKLSGTRHQWNARLADPTHLTTMLSAGIHIAGWWIATYREPEPWLQELGDSAGLRTCGPPAPQDHLRALRAWAEVRLDPRLPTEMVTAGDRYVAHRPTDADDFLPEVDRWLLTQPVVHTGRIGQSAHCSG